MSLFGPLSLTSFAFFSSQSLSSFLKICPYHLNLFHCTTIALFCIPNLLNTIQDIWSLYLNPCHLILISPCYNAISFSVVIGYISLPRKDTDPHACGIYPQTLPFQAVLPVVEFPDHPFLRVIF